MYFKNKLQNYIWYKIVSLFFRNFFYPFIYKSFWYYLFHKHVPEQSISNNFYSARPNSGAGIGHQMANWISGYWFAKQFGLQYAHSPFSNLKWEDFLGFGANEFKVLELRKMGYKKVMLPLFDEFNLKEVDLQKANEAHQENKNEYFCRY